MSPATTGRHCAQCDHVVADLTRATDAELLTLFTSDARPKCARFDPAQLDRAIGHESRQRQQTLPVAAFTSLLAVALGTEAVAQQGAPLRTTIGEVDIRQPAPPPPMVKGKMMMTPAVVDSMAPCTTITGDTVATVTPDPDLLLRRIELGNVSVRIMEEPMVEFCGTVLDDETGEAIPFVLVQAEHMEGTTATGEDGTFTLRVPARQARELVVLNLRTIGFEMRAVEVFPSDSTTPSASHPFMELPQRSVEADDPLRIVGFVEDAVSGDLLEGALVRLVGTSVRGLCDERGRFQLSVPSSVEGHELKLEFRAPDGREMQLAVLRSALPITLPVKFNGPRPSDVFKAAETCKSAGIIRMKPERRTVHVTSGIVAVTRLKEPSAWQRLIAPIRRTWHRLKY